MLNTSFKLNFPLSSKLKEIGLANNVPAKLKSIILTISFNFKVLADIDFA
jgi:hypothetical protein